MLGESEDGEEHYAEYHTGDRRLILREQVHDRGRKQHRGDDDQAERNFRFADVQIARHLPLAIPRLGKAQHQNCQGLHGDTTGRG